MQAIPDDAGPSSQGRDIPELAGGVEANVVRHFAIDRRPGHRSEDPVSGTPDGAGEEHGMGREVMVVFGSGIAALAVLLGSAVAASAAGDKPPALDVTATCAAAGALARDRASCLDDERAARDQLDHSWSKYGAADKAHCIANVTSGGSASYVELVTCLDVMKGARDAMKGERDTGTSIAEDPPPREDPPPPAQPPESR